MKQATLAAAADQGAEFERFQRPTRRDVFLQTMDSIVPWADLCAVVEPHYPKAGKGRPPIRLERMLNCERLLNTSLQFLHLALLARLLKRL